jgi:predicted PurR-regulated permease PerM
VALLPYLGIIVGGLPVLVLGFGVASGLEVAVAALVAVLLQVVEVLWWRPRVDRRSLHVGPAVPVVVAILGYGIYGIGGALYGCVLAVLGLAVADQLWPGAELPTPLTDSAD